jgi:hypothetical protein
MRKQCPNKKQKYDLSHNNQIFVKIISVVSLISQLLSPKNAPLAEQIPHLFFAA